GASNGSGMAMKESDYPILERTMNTQHHLLLFTSLGNYIYQPVHELPDIKWRDLGQHISSIVSLESCKSIEAAIGLEQFDDIHSILTVTANGFVKLSKLADFHVQRYGRAYKGMNVKKGDRLLDARIVKGSEDAVLVTHQAYILRFPLSDVGTTGVRTGG